MMDEPTEVIAPREGLPHDRIDFLREMLQGSYAAGATLEYHGFELHCHHEEGGARVWSIYNPDGVFIETVNLEAFRTVTELEAFLDKLVAYEPADRMGWKAR